MNKKLRVAVLFGGKSAEHEVSLQSARSIIEALDKSKYEIVLIGITKQGLWYLNEASRFILQADDPKLIKLNGASNSVALVPGDSKKQLVSLSGSKPAESIDVVFPVLHGTYGEDGTIQGLLKLANLPFVGPSVLGSAIGMDKDVLKRLLREAGLPIASFRVFDRRSAGIIDNEAIVSDLGLPLFVKPANLGSSVGVHKVKSLSELQPAIVDAFRFDNKILIEEFIDGREIECSVLGNSDPIASIPGEIIPQHEFYSYEAKYIDEKGAILKIPAELSAELAQEARDLAIKAFRVACCEGMSRVDMFLTGDNRLIVNEINTIPGFTKISMYPKLWEATGISYPELLDRLIQLALERFEQEQELETSREN